MSTTRPVSALAVDVERWFAYACELEGENAQLRRWLASLFTWLAERDELLEHARDLAAQRWSETT